MIYSEITSGGQSLSQLALNVRHFFHSFNVYNRVCIEMTYFFLDAPILSLSAEPSKILIEDETYNFNCQSSAIPETNKR